MYVFGKAANPKTAGELVNMDFDFDDRRMRYEGRYVAVVPLPSYPVDRIRTGQFAAGASLGCTAQALENAPVIPHLVRSSAT